VANVQLLEIKDGKVANRFEITDGEKNDKGQIKFVPAEAVLEKDELVLSGKGVEKPITARYTIDRLPEFWEAQAACLKIPNTGMVVTTDLVDNIDDFRPKNKFDVGNRLALWALARHYGKKETVYSGPLYKSMKVDGDKIRLSFAQTGSGLKSRDGKPLSEFEIAGNDGKFVTAEASIDGIEVVVSGKGVEKPTQVRFGWRKIANPNLSNKEGLPASPFRTKDWKGGTGE
jgi:sialate O-acetylesterase